MYVARIFANLFLLLFIFLFTVICVINVKILSLKRVTPDIFNPDFLIAPYIVRVIRSLKFFCQHTDDDKSLTQACELSAFSSTDYWRASTRIIPQ